MPRNTRNNPFLTPNVAASSPQPSSPVVIGPVASIPNRDPDPDVLGLSEDAPPAYTIAADVRHGESTLEVGPRRPFQPAPQPPRQHLSPDSVPGGRSHSHERSQSHSRTEQPSFWQQLATLALSDRPPRRPSSAGPPVTSSSGTARSDWLAFPGQQVSSNSNNSSRIVPVPPPRHPSSSSLGSSPRTRARATSEFARDFYATGPATGLGNRDAPLPDLPADASSSDTLYPPPPGRPPVASSSIEREVSSTHLSSTPAHTGTTSEFALDFYAADPALIPLDTGSTYAPPPGPPPSTASGSNGIPDDGKPTRTPVPGHPLLKDNQVLVYPAGHNCEKCELSHLWILVWFVQGLLTAHQAATLATNTTIQRTPVASAGPNTGSPTLAPSFTPPGHLPPLALVLPQQPMAPRPRFKSPFHAYVPLPPPPQQQASSAHPATHALSHNLSTSLHGSLNHVSLNHVSLNHVSSLRIHTTILRRRAHS
jgi:hypothetical protein